MTVKNVLNAIKNLVGGDRRTAPVVDNNSGEAQDDGLADDDPNPFPDPVVLEFRDVLDLHSIPPKLVKQIVEEFLEEAHHRHIKWVRIIHGKGIGVQREMVRSILARTSYVVEYGDAPGNAGGWGATVATLRE